MNYRKLYARIKAAMTYTEALSIFGFPPGSSPTEQEIKRRYRSLAFENHPDRGGDATKMVAINAAKDMLLEGPPTVYDYGRSPSTRANPPKRKPNPEDHISFDEACIKAGVPKGVNWIYSTQGSFEHYGSETEIACLGVFGRSAREYIFVGIQHTVSQNAFTGLDRDVYEVHVKRIPQSDPNAWKDPSWHKQNMNDVLNKLVCKKGWRGKITVHMKQKELRPYMPGKDTTLQRWLANVAGVYAKHTGKTVIEIAYEKNWMEKTQDVVLIINKMREYKLTPSEAKRVLDNRRLMEAIFGRYFYEKGKKIITRKQKHMALAILKQLLKVLAGAPDWVRDALESAIAERI